jgi:hypothetical protein
MKHASAYLRKGKTYPGPFLKKTKSLPVSWDPVVVSSENDVELGMKVLEVLGQSTVNVPHSESWVGRSDLMAKAGSRSGQCSMRSPNPDRKPIDEPARAIPVSIQIERFSLGHP